MYPNPPTPPIPGPQDGNRAGRTGAGSDVYSQGTATPPPTTGTQPPRPTPGVGAPPCPPGKIPKPDGSCADQPQHPAYADPAQQPVAAKPTYADVMNGYAQQAAPGGGGAGGAGANANGLTSTTIADWAYNNIDSTLPREYWNYAVQYFDPACPGKTPFRSKKTDDAGKVLGTCEEKPDNCPHGTAAYGESKCLPVTDPRIAGRGGAGGAGGAGGGGGPWGGGPAGWAMTAEEKAYLGAMTDLARQMADQSAQTFGAGMPAYRQGVEYYKGAMGAYGRSGVQAATAPAAEQIADAYKGAGAQLQGLRGAELAQAKGELARGQAGDTGRLAAELQPAAADALTRAGEFGISTGIAGEGQAAALYAGGQQSLQQGRLAQQGFQTQKDIAKLQASTSWDIAALQASVSREQLGQQRALGWAQLAQSSAQWEQEYQLKRDQFAHGLDQFNQQLGAQKSANKAAFWGGVIGVVGTAAVVL